MTGSLEEKSRGKVCIRRLGAVSKQSGNALWKVKEEAYREYNLSLNQNLHLIIPNSIDIGIERKQEITLYEYISHR